MDHTLLFLCMSSKVFVGNWNGRYILASLGPGSPHLLLLFVYLFSDWLGYFSEVYFPHHERASVKPLMLIHRECSLEYAHSHGK